MDSATHKAGFVSIIGLPNAGKSALMNSLTGEKLSITSHKVQTTRHRVMGLINGEDYQIVFSDTPGIIQPKYELQKTMMKYVNMSMEDADIIVYLYDIQNPLAEEEAIIKKLNAQPAIKIILINKIDLADEKTIKERIKEIEALINAHRVIPISAKENFNIKGVFDEVIQLLPNHPPYFPKDELSDKSERFFASEFIREQIFLNCEKEVPYSTEVVISGFKQAPTALHIYAEIFVERDSQKGIIIGKQGSMLKKIGSKARLEMEKFFGRKVFLEQHVKVDPDWRRNDKKLARYGYL